MKLHLSFLESVLNELPNPIFLKDSDARFVFFNKAYGKFFDVNTDQLLGLTVLDLHYLEPEIRQRYHEEDLYCIANGAMFHYETQYKTKQGMIDALYWAKGFYIPGLNQKALVGMIVDISPQKKLEKELVEKTEELERSHKQLEESNNIDHLTQLFNRRFFYDLLEDHVNLSNRHHYPLSVMMLDLDHFKGINDNFGHQQGDVVLKEFAQLLKDNSRNGDVVARYGGEEFLLLLPFTKADDALNVANRILQETRKKIILPDGKSVTTSIGLVQYSHNDSLDQFINRADQALYRSKENGRNRVTIDA